MMFKKCLGIFAVIGLMAACNFTEEIYLNDDGSGKLSIHFDGNELMSMIGEMDSLQHEEVIDSTIVFKHLLEEKKDSISKLSQEEQAKLKKLEPFSMRIAMNPKAAQMQFELLADFEEIGKMDDAFNAFQNASSLSPTGELGAGQSMPMITEESPTKINYSFIGNTFSRTTEIINQELFQKRIDSLSSAEMFLSGSTYTFKYHFPRKVKSVNIEGATFSLDGKTMTYEVSMLDMTKTPEAIDLLVELED